MKIGVIYPQNELGGSFDAVLRFAEAAENLGYDYLLAFDHVLGADHADRQPPLEGPYELHDSFHDPFVLFAYLAGRAPHLEFATGVLVLPQRQTALVARQAADLAILSEGRFRLGVGVGWNHVEYDALGQSYATRGKRADEQIGVLRSLWTEPVVSFDGEFDHLERVALVPRPPKAIPIWIGGYSEAAYRRGARIGDGFIFGGGIEYLEKTWTRVKELLGEHGREIDGFGAEYMVRSMTGVDGIAEKIERWRHLGGTHSSVLTMQYGFDSIDAHVDYIARVADRLGLTPRSSWR